MKRWKRFIPAGLALCLLLTLAACGEKEGEAKKLLYPAAYLSTAAQVDTVNSLTRVNTEGTFYTLEYTADYKLQELLQADISDLQGLLGWAQSNLLSTEAGAVKASPGGGCSAFVSTNDEGELIFSRNYDYVQNAQNILVHCTPADGYESVSIAAGGWLYSYNNSGAPIVLDDGKTDLSMLVTAPYLLMDGMNEKGVVICVLTVDGSGTVQSDPNKHSLQTTTAMRLVLDRAASVPEAIELLQQYNMNASITMKNFHFYIADAEGNYGIIEYSPNGEMRYSADENGNCLNLFSDTDGSYDQRLVTNFYRLFPAAEYGFDDGTHGLDRFLTLSQGIAEASDCFTESQAMTMLGSAYQDFGDTATHETQWSEVYNPSDMTAKICPRVAQTDQKDAFYASVYDFNFKAAFEVIGAVTYTKESK